MKFSDYIVIESTGNSVDPLGFLRPSSALADGMFKQFTVLSNHPAYQGFLAFAFIYLESKGKRPGTQKFSKEFRDVEVLWGILNGRAAVSILNVTKYVKIAEDENASLLDAQSAAYAALYAKLNYGTLGHYSSPSIFWGILNAKGTDLTPLGRKLGLAWSNRGGLNFGTLLDAWLAKKTIATIEYFAQAVELFHLKAAPSQEERGAWKEIIDAYCTNTSVVKPLWSNPPTTEMQALAAEESSFHSYYPAILEHYKQFPDLCERIDLGRQFELLAALAQFVFEWEYVNRLDEVKKMGLAAPLVKKSVAEILVQRSAVYLNARGYKDAGKMFQKIALDNTYDAVASTLLTHHVEHQRSKGASPFIQGKDIVVQGRVDPKVFSTFLQNLESDPLALERKIAWRYRRDWHFGRAATWLSYTEDQQ